MSNKGYSKEQQNEYFYHGACPECGSAEDLEPNDWHDRGIRTRSRLVYCNGCDAEFYEVHFRDVGCRFLSREEEDEEPDEDDDDVDSDEGEDEEDDKIASFIKPILTVEILEFAIKRMQRSQPQMRRSPHCWPCVFCKRVSGPLPNSQVNSPPRTLIQKTLSVTGRGR